MKKLIAAAIAAIAATVFAETTPVMVSLVTPVQAPSSSYDVTGFRLSLIYGECQEFTGFEIGIANRSASDFTGVGVGGVNIANGKVTGGQLGLVNWNDSGDASWEGRSKGLQLGVVNYSRNFCGLQDGILSVCGSKIVGAQGSYVNFAKDVGGAQVGYLNVASGAVNGCQVGLVNYADTMVRGLQVGIVNIISNDGWFPVLPIVNGNF